MRLEMPQTKNKSDDEPIFCWNEGAVSGDFCKNIFVAIY